MSYQIKRLMWIQKKIKAILRLKWLINVKEIHSLLGLTKYYQRFIEEFLMISSPMTQLTQKRSSLNRYTSVKKVFLEFKKHWSPNISSSQDVIRVYNI